MLVFSLVVGLIFGVNLILYGKEDIENKNRTIMESIPCGSRVLAPVRIMFDEIKNYDIVGIHPARLIMKKRNLPFTTENLCDFAREAKVQDIVLNEEFLHDLGCKKDCVDFFECDGFEKTASVKKHQIFTLKK